MSQRIPTEEERIKEKLEGQAYDMERRAFWSKGTSPDKFPGLCGTCKYLRLAKTQYGGIKRAVCAVFEMAIDPRDPVDECTEYWKRGQLTLPEMVERAKLISIKGREYTDEKLYM